jgi:hypothetical protein
VQRLYGAIAIFAGWLSIIIGAVAGLVASEFLGLNHKEGGASPLAVYGISAAFVLWIFILAAFTAGVPMAYAMFANDPRTRLRVMGMVEGIVGLMLLPDPLGRAFGLPLIVGAICLLIGGELIHMDSRAHGTAEGRSYAATWHPGMQAGTPPPAEDPAEPQAPASIAPAAPVVATADLPPASEPATARGRRSSRNKAAAPQRPCPWCGEPVAVDAETCPSCKATIVETGIAEMPIPGLTEIQPALRRYLEQSRSGKKRGVLGGMLSGSSVLPLAGTAPASDASAIRPPSAELKAEMARLDAEIAAGRGPIAPERAPESQDKPTP